MHVHASVLHPYKNKRQLHTTHRTSARMKVGSEGTNQTAPERHIYLRVTR